MVNNKNVAHTFQIEDHGWSLINLLLCTSIIYMYMFVSCPANGLFYGAKGPL